MCFGVWLPAGQSRARTAAYPTSAGHPSTTCGRPELHRSAAPPDHRWTTGPGSPAGRTGCRIPSDSPTLSDRLVQTGARPSGHRPTRADTRSTPTRPAPSTLSDNAADVEPTHHHVAEHADRTRAGAAVGLSDPSTTCGRPELHPSGAPPAHRWTTGPSSPAQSDKAGRSAGHVHRDGHAGHRTDTPDCGDSEPFDTRWTPRRHQPPRHRPPVRRTPDRWTSGGCLVSVLAARRHGLSLGRGRARCGLARYVRCAWRHVPMSGNPWRTPFGRPRRRWTVARVL